MTRKIGDGNLVLVYYETHSVELLAVPCAAADNQTITC